MQGDLEILTPERAVLNYRLAGVGSRATAHLLDILILGAVLVAVWFATAALAALVDPYIATGLAMFLTFVLAVLYFVLGEGLGHGQTIGKRVLGLRVRMADGTPLSLEAAILRNLLRAADFLPVVYLMGLGSIFLSPRAQRLGDLVAGTVVVTERHEGTRYAVAPHGVGLHPLEVHVGPLRGLTMPEYSALRRLADRFYELPPATQNRLLGTIYRPLAKRLGVPDPPQGETEIRMVEAIVMAYGRRKGLL